VGRTRLSCERPRLTWQPDDGQAIQSCYANELVLALERNSVGQWRHCFIGKCQMTQLDAQAIGSEGEPHPLARETHRQIREAVDRSERSLRWFGEGESENTIAEILDAQGRLVREVGQQVVAVAYQLDNLVALVRTMQSDEE
jgi:hypothetical protein